MRQYSGDDECALHDFDGRPGPARELTEAEGGARAHGWNELRDGAAEAAAASRARGWGRLAWPPPRWPPPNLVVDAWEAKISALARDAETRVLADIAAADAADDSATQSAPETSRSAPARAASTSWTTLSAATVEANCGASSPSDALRLDLAAENVRDVSALPDLCPRLRALVLNVNALDTLDGLERLPLLRRLSARHNAIRVPGFVAGGFRELRALALDGNPLRSLDHLAAAAPSLEAFSARACGLGAAAFAAELATPRLSATLTELHLAGNPLGARGVSTLTEKSEFPNLLKLNVSDARVVYLEGLERCPLLSVLVATDNRIVRLPESFRRRRDGSGSGACPPGGGAHAALRELRLDRNRLEEIPDLWLPSLTSLHARENRVRRIGDLGGAPHLAVLDVAFNRVGDVPGAPPLRPAFDVATAPRLERLALNDNPVAAVEGYPDELFPFLRELREVDGASVPREAIVAATDALARDTPLLAETLGEALERRRARATVASRDEDRIAKDAPMIAESVGTEELEAMSRVRWEARLASDRQALRRARKHLARVDDAAAAAAAGTTADRRDNDALVVRLEDVPDARERETPNARSRRVDVDSDEDDANAVPEDVAGGRVESSGNADAFAGDSVALSPPPGEAGALLLATMPPPPGPAPGARASDVDDARWAHHAWRMATSRVVDAVVAAAAASDWRLDDAATEGEEILDPDAKVSAAAREAARAAVAAVVDYDPEQFQDVVVKSGGNEPSTRDDAAANAAATTIQTGWRAGRARAAARRTEARRAAATTVQAAWRGSRTRREEASRRRIEARARAEAKTRALAKARAEAEAKALAEAEAKTRALAKARAEAEAKALAEAEAKTRALAEAKAEAEAKTRALAEAKARVPVESSAAVAIQSSWRGWSVRRRFARARAAARFDDDNDDDFAGVEEAFYAPPANLDLDDVDLDFDLDLDATAGVASLASSSTLGEIFRDAATTEVATTATAEASASSSSSSRRGKEWAHLLPRASAEDWPMSRLASSSAESRGGDDSEAGSSARAMERKLEEAASDWGLRERGPAAEAFYRNRAKLLKQEQRRKEREALKDPLKRVRRFHRVAAGTAAANAAGPGSAANAAASAARRAKFDSGGSGSSRTTTDAARRGTAFEFVGSGSGSGSAFGSAFGSGSALLSRDFAADATTTRRRIVYTPPAMAETGSKTGRSSGRTHGGSAVRRERGESREMGRGRREGARR